MGCYVRVPIEFGRMERSGEVLFGAFLRIGKTRITTVVGYGSTEDEALADLIQKIGYEVNDGPLR